MLKISQGEFYPLGARVGAGWINFALYSANATAVTLELFDSPDGAPTQRIPILQKTRNVWHVRVEGVGHGQLYGYRVDGPFRPEAGLRFNPHKLLLDPYAKALTHKAVNRDNLLLAYDAASPSRDLSLDLRDNGAVMPRCVALDDRFDWQGDHHPHIPLEKTILYEIHLKGFTRHPSSDVQEPGTYLGLIQKLPYLKELGVTALELLPIHENYVEDFIHSKGLGNFWGYSTLGFFAPELSYGSDRRPGRQVEEFKTLVREAHKHGLEVILDVVYNHTCEGSELGPTLSLKGIDNPSYYALAGTGRETGRYYQNYTGCGNSLDLGKPASIRLVMDSLRYWVEHMHVDGFRFDLASVLGREEGTYRTGASFFDVVSQDPVLTRVKLIAEPWDCGSYDVGNFPLDWSEWNGRFRDTVRKFNKGDRGQLRELGWRMTGSADLYGDDGRTPGNSINFVTCHDGFTLYDLYSYNTKHNEANQENNSDGSNDNHSWNCGVEGPTQNADVIRLRHRLARNAFCHLLLACGTPMILGGDEFLRTQLGNNNAYCQDNGLSWVDWSLLQQNAPMHAFVKDLIALLHRFPILMRRRFLSGKDQNGNAIPDIAWFAPDGNPPRWNDAQAMTLCYMLDGSEDGVSKTPYLLYLVFNAAESLVHVRLPSPPPGAHWRRLIDTSFEKAPIAQTETQQAVLSPQDHYLVNPRTVVVLVA